MSSKKQENWLGHGLVRNKDPTKVAKQAKDPPGAAAMSNGESVKDRAAVASASTEAGKDKEQLEALKKLFNTPSPKDKAMDAISRHIDDDLPKHLDPRHASFKDPLYQSGKISLCDICGEEEGRRAGGELLQCATIVTGYHGCGKWFHVGCVRRDVMPDGDWLCRKCSNAQTVNSRPVGDEGIELIPDEEDAKAFAAARELETVEEEEEQDTTDEEEQEEEEQDTADSDEEEQDAADDDDEYVETEDDASDKKPAAKKQNKSDSSIDGNEEEANDADTDRKKRAERRNQQKERKIVKGTYFDDEDSDSDEETPAKVQKKAPSRKRAHDVASNDVDASSRSKRSKSSNGKDSKKARRKEPTLNEKHYETDDDDDIGIECLRKEEPPRRAGSPARTILQQNDSKVRVRIKQTQKAMETLMVMSRPLSRTPRYDKTDPAHRLKAKAEVGFPNMIHGTFCFQFQTNNECGSGQPQHLEKPILKMWTGTEHATKVVVRKFRHVHKALDQHGDELPFELNVFDDFEDYHESFRGNVGKAMSKNWQRDHAEDDDNEDTSEH